MANQGGAHQWTITTLMNIGTVIDHPLSHGEPFGTGRSPRHAALGDPSKWTVLSVTERSVVQSRVSSDEVFDAFEIIGVNGLLKLADFFE
jgi:hypothetical protein